MKSMQLREAKAKFSALVEAAENGETTLITKNGRPAARVAPVEQASSVQAEKRPNLIDHLMSMPAEIPIRRNRSRARSVKF